MLRERLQPPMAIRAAIRIHHIHTARPAIMVLDLPCTPPPRLRALSPAQALSPLAPANVRPAITGCLIQAAGVWLTGQLMCRRAALRVIRRQAILPRAVLPGAGQPFLLRADGAVNLVLPGILLLVPVNHQGVPYQVEVLIVAAGTLGMATAASHHPDQGQAVPIPQEVARVMDPIMIILPAAARRLPIQRVPL